MREVRVEHYRITTIVSVNELRRSDCVVRLLVRNRFFFLSIDNLHEYAERETTQDTAEESLMLLILLNLTLKNTHTCNFSVCFHSFLSVDSLHEYVARETTQDTAEESLELLILLNLTFYCSHTCCHALTMT
ncbi:hypothetical protein E2C01_013317 [Portunus trituberculatus]|uniref:Uncharacterized protein n=1 Tax=Portunus trituberculatus TaxID=210409 RepID=A0A5B7DH03_PORTR|nr:hypothetical protein [Portunus trituberculatus]